MTKNKKGGKKDKNKSGRKAAESSAKDNVTNKGKNGMTDSSDIALKTAGSSGNNQASANTPPNMAEKKREKMDNVKTLSVTNAAMQTDTELSKNKDTNAASKDSDNPTSRNQKVALSTDKSKNKRRKFNTKSEPGTSGVQELASAEYEGNTHDCSDTFLGNVDMQKLIAARISTIESGANEPKSIKYMHMYKSNRSPTQEEKRKSTFNTADENINSSKDKLVLVPANKSKSHDSIKLFKKDITISSCLTPETVRSASNSQASANPAQNMAERERTEKTTSVIHAAMQSHSEEANNENENARGKDSDNLTSLSRKVALSAEKSKKKRRRNRGKSASSFLGIESLASAEYEGHKLDCSDTFIDKDVDMRKSINARVSAIESGTTEQKSIKKYKMECSLSQERKRNITFNNNGDENVENYSKENQITIPDNDRKTDDFIRLVIFVTDKSTQTDPLQDPPDISKHTDNKDNSALKTDSDRTVRAEATESDLLLPSEESNLENVLKDIGIRNKSGSNLSSLDQNLQSISEDFLRHLKILSENFVDDFIKSLKNEN